VLDHTVLNLFPAIPPVALLDAFSQPQVRRVLSDELAPSRSLRFMFTGERQLPHGIRISFSYTHSRTQRTQRVVNINAPLGGTFIPGVPNSGTRPLGADAGNVLEYQPTGKSVGNFLNGNLNGNAKKLNFWAGFGIGKTRSRDGGTSGAPFDAYDFSNEWARANFGPLFTMYGGGNYQGPHGFNLNLFVYANTGQTFNITTGRDTNGDTYFSERPAFATDLTKPGVVVTPLGAFDPNPGSGQEIIPRNFGRGPASIFTSLSVEKVFKFGPAIEPKSPPPGAPRTTESSNPSQPPPKPPVQRPYTLSFGTYINNLFNRNNQGNPVGNMTSPYFLKSASGSNNFSFGPGGGSGGNRIISLRVRISF